MKILKYILFFISFNTVSQYDLETDYNNDTSEDNLRYFDHQFFFDSEDSYHSKLQEEVNFISAIRNGNLKKVKKILKNISDVNFPAEIDDSPPLIIAVRYHQFDIVKLLLANGALINAKNNKGDTALFIAIICNNIDMVKLLIESKANLNEKNNLGQTPLMVSLYNNFTDIALLILEHKVRLNVKNNYGKSTLMYAIITGEIEIVKKLLEKFAYINARNKWGTTPLMFATIYDQPEILKLLLDNRANINDQNVYGKTALMHAANKSNIEIFKTLLDYGADINIKDNLGKTAANYTETWYDDGIINLLKSSVKSWKQNIIDSIYNGDFNNFKKYLLKVGTICFKDKDGNNLLHHAMKTSKIEFVKIIIRIKPELIYQRNNNGEIPLNFMSVTPIFKFIKNLIEQVNLHDFFKASIENNMPKIRDLLQLGVNINSTDKDGNTALHYACMYSQINIIKYLIEKGANLNSENLFGQKPIDFAIIYSPNDEIITLLNPEKPNKKRKL